MVSIKLDKRSLNASKQADANLQIFMPTCDLKKN